ARAGTLRRRADRRGGSADLREDPDQDGPDRELPRDRHVPAVAGEPPAHRQRQQHPAGDPRPPGGEGGPQRDVRRHHLPVPRPQGRGGGEEQAEGEGPMTSRARPAIWCLALTALLVLACGQSTPPPPTQAAKPAAPKPPPPPPEAPIPAATAYVHNPVGKRAPFRSPEAEPASQAALNANCNEPLCRFDIDQLTLVAVVSGDANPLAMVQDPAGRGYFVRRNTRVGRQGGKVTQIMSDAVV